MMVYATLFEGRLSSSHTTHLSEISINPIAQKLLSARGLHPSLAGIVTILYFTLTHFLYVPFFGGNVTKGSAANQRATSASWPVL